jgi:serine/threonine protein kinase
MAWSGGATALAPSEGRLRRVLSHGGRRATLPRRVPGIRVTVARVPPSAPVVPPHDTAPAADNPSATWLEDLVADALEALDRRGDEGLAAFLERHPRHRQQVLDLIAGFRGTGLLARDARDRVPERLGEFRLLERLGAGGMGVVFLAEQESLQRTVALKIIRPDLVFFGGTRERFRREIEVIARLAHPAIVPIVATGEHDGMPWYAMQRIDGCTVDQAVKRLRGRDPAQLKGADLERAIRGTGDAPSQLDRTVFADGYWQACVRLVRQAALGLEHAHREGVVHRDVKPSNVMLTPDGRALLLDFGLARVHGDPKLTNTGGEPGSPAYMAPEQVRGTTADERADVYSLAATLFQLLDLEPPFASPDPEQLRQMILRGKVGGLRNCAGLPELKLVLAAAMDVDRDRRYASAAEFAADLAAVLARRPIRARPLPLHVRSVRWLQRHRKTSTMLGALALLAVVLPVVLVWQQGQSLAALRIEKQRGDTSRQQLLTAIRQFLAGFAAGSLQSMPGGREVASELLKEAVAQLESMPPDADPLAVQQHRLYATRWLVASLRLVGKFGEARSRALAALAEWPESARPNQGTSLLLATLRSEVLELAVAGRAIDDVAEHVRRTELELARAAEDESLRGAVDEARVHFAMDCAELAGMNGDDAAAERRLREALDCAALTTVMTDRTATIAVLRNRLGDRLRERGALAEADEQFRAALTAMTPAGDPTEGRPEAIRIRAHSAWGLARIHGAREAWPECEREYGVAAALAEASLFAYPHEVACLSLFGCVLTEFAQVRRHRGAPAAEVTAMLQRARGAFARIRQHGPLDVRAKAAALVNLTTLLEQHGKQQDAAATADAARAMAELAAGDATRQAMAAWRLLQAALWFDAADDEDAAAACDADALCALQACDAAGWFPPVNLDDAPCMRLRGHPEFEALRAKHPPEQASRRRPK